MEAASETWEPPMTVTVNVTYVSGTTRRSVDPMLAWANEHVYAQANITLVKGVEITLDEAQSRAALGDWYPVMTEYGDSSDPTEAHKRLYRHLQTANAITVYFVQQLSQDSAGEAFSPSNEHGLTGADIGDKGTCQTVAHEIGHVLLNPGPHVPDERNLMHAKDGLEKTQLTSSQIERMRASRFAVPAAGYNPFG